ncbi:MAG: NADH-quinone oxidoreductase subunit N [Ignavibacteria bacterium]|nr:NADH-quinone oxidoreductase subunit N [Ignavibacteria bacterium]MBK7446649.1 NADH-quinone oxidoreductase subunit N [Ignavibacteria bacterium]MBK9405621.1 NADH-quinone oxidoreductase subunit N [Ignavibacteria bacterium]
MDFGQFLYMRHEIILSALALIVLIMEISSDKKSKANIIPVLVALFFINTVAGFLPVETGSLFGGMYKTTALIILMKNILNAGVLIVFIQSAGWLKSNFTGNDNIGGYFFIVISSLIGMDFMISAGNFLMFYIGLELATIPLAALVASEKLKERSAEAGVKLILSAALSSGILLYGLSLLYGTNGSLYFDNIASSFQNNSLQVLAFIFIFTGIAFKISIVPFHLWTADVYEGAPVNITSFLSVISKASAVFILIILLFTVFRGIEGIWNSVLYFTSVLTMTIGNLFAIRQKNIKRFLAFSSIAQAGFIPLGIIGGSALGFSSVVYFVLIYLFSNLGAFGVVAAITNKTGKESIDEYNGLYSTNKGLSLVMMLSLFSLAGIPPVAGFFGKFFLFTSAAKQGYYLLVFIALINATVSLYYYLLVVKAMFINKNDVPIETIKNDGYTKLGLIICTIGIIAIGFAGIIFDYINSLTFGIK